MKLNELQKFVKNFFFKILAALLTVFVNIYVVSHLSKVLSLEGFGKLNFIQTYVSYFTLFISLGMDVAAMRIMAIDKERIRETFSSLLTIKWILSIGILFLMLIPSFFVAKLAELRFLLVVFSLNLLLPPFPFQSVYEATKRMEIPSLISIFQQILNLVLIKIYVLNPEHIINIGYICIIINLFSLLVNSAFYIKHYGMWTLRFGAHEWKGLLKSGVIIGFIQITVMMIHYTDVFILGFITDDASVGLYSAAYRALFMVISGLSIFHGLMNPILFENFSKNFEKFKTFFHMYIKFIIYGGYGLTVIFIFLARDYLNIFYDLKVYYKSIFTFKILMISLLFMTINSPLHSGLLSAHKEKLLLKIIVFQVSMNILLNFILIPSYGINGAAVATVLTEVAGLYFYIYFFRRIYKVQLLKHFIVALISVLPMGIFLYFSGLFFILKALIGVLIMVCVIFLLKGYTVTEFHELKKMLIPLKK